MTVRRKLTSILLIAFLSGFAVPGRPQSPAASSPDPDLLRKLGKIGALHRPVPTARMPGCDSHAGTVDACPLTIEAGVADGLVELSSKGLMAGDNISITVDNLTPKQCDAVTVRLFLEFYGPAATEGVALIVKDAIEGIWSGHTSTDGRKVTVEVVTTVAPGDTAPPNTPGFHQIKVFDQDFRDVVYGMGTDFDINRGSGEAEWDAAAENSQFAHEAGHLMMFQDFYDDYTRMPNDIWKNETDGTTVTTGELAQLFIRNYPTWTLAERLQFLQRFSVGKGVSLSRAGYEKDIMANYDLGSVQQWEIDQLASRADGVVVKIKTGTVVIPKNGRTQGMVVTHEEHVHVQKGGSKRCDGLFGACINDQNAIPENGDAFDLLPPLDSWPDTTVAPLLLKLVRGIDKKKWYGDPWLEQWCIWRLTNNAPVYDTTAANFLREMGIDPAQGEYHMPQLADLDSASTGTKFTLCAGLVTATISPRATLTQIGSLVTLTGSVILPAAVDTSVHLAWRVAGPDSSRSILADGGGGRLLLTPDVRGMYNPVLDILVKRGSGPAAIMDRPSNGFVVAADARTETFESGSLRAGAPFFWYTTPPAPWIVSDSASFSGTYALRSLPAQSSEESIVSVRFFIPDSASISFAFKAAAGRLIFADAFADTILASNHRPVPDWSYTTIRLAPGTHDVSWIYYDDSPDSTGRMAATGAWLDDIFFPPNATLIRTPVERDPPPVAYSLSQNYPNPVTGETAIRFALPAAQSVRLVLYDILGHEVRSLLDETRPAGEQSVTFNSAGLAPGVYFYRLTAGQYSAMKSLTILK